MKCVLAGRREIFLSGASTNSYCNLELRNTFALRARASWPVWPADASQSSSLATSSECRPYCSAGDPASSGLSSSIPAPAAEEGGPSAAQVSDSMSTHTSFSAVSGPAGGATRLQTIRLLQAIQSRRSLSQGLIGVRLSRIVLGLL